MGVTKTRNVKRNGTENGMKRKICNVIYIFLRITYMNTFSLYKSLLFRTDDVDVLYIYHKVVIQFSRVNEKAIK